MNFSRHNIISRITDSDKFFIVNLLSGNADILPKEKGEEILEGRYTDIDEYVSKGYLINQFEEDRQFRQRYADFLDARDSDEVQIFFVPWYTCNFACSYCYQDGYGNGNTVPGNEVIDAFFHYIGDQFAGRRKYVTLFGGEPLLPGKEHENAIRVFLERAQEARLDTAIVTNGFTLKTYADTLASYKIREVQVTLDGPPRVHDLRRPLKGGQSTFEEISSGIDRALALGLAINLRVVIDRENIDSLPALAQYAIDKGWTRHTNFKTQIGRNYELHYCQTDRSKLLSRIELYKELYGMIQRHPEVMEFHKPAFSISKFLFENGELPSPLYDSCPGTKTEWAFDATGSIYSCTATVGKKEESLGTFFPTVVRKMEVMEQWEERDVTAIPECTACSVRLACGGGCASVAFNKSGRILAPDCRPVKELLEMGISTYFKKELA